MGLFDSFAGFLAEARSAIFGPNHANEAKRKKKAAARRRYRANVRRRILQASIEGGNSVGTQPVSPDSAIADSCLFPESDPSTDTPNVCVNRPGCAIPVAAHLPTEDDNSNEIAVDSPPTDDHISDNSDAISIADVNGDADLEYGDAISMADFNEEADPDYGDAISIAVDNEEADPDDGKDLSNADDNVDAKREAASKPGDRTNNGVFDVDSPSSSEVINVDSSSSEGEVKYSSSSDGEVEHSSSSEGEVEYSSSSEGEVDCSDNDMEVHDVDHHIDDDSSALELDGEPVDDDNNPGPAIEPAEEPPQPIRRPSLPRVLQAAGILNTIPKNTRSDDQVWSRVSLPDLMGLVVFADDLGRIFVIPRSFFGSQIYTARHLAYEHTVMDLCRDLRPYLEGLSRARDVVWYSPDDDHRDNFFVVFNTPRSIQRVLPDFPFHDLAEYTRQRETPGLEQAGRQPAKLNRGYTGTQSMGPRDTSGHPIPVLKEGTDDPAIVSSFQAASGYISRLNVPWNENRPLLVPRERSRLFSSNIGEGVIFEGSSHSTHQRCRWHRDVQNPSPDEREVSHVTTISRRLEGGRYIVSIYYFRRSISVNLRRNVTTDSIVRHFSESFLSFPLERRSFSCQTIGDGQGFCAVAPNLDPIAFHSLVDICIATLVHRFGLNLYECLSLFVAYLYLPNTAEPFGRAAIRILQDARMGRGTTGHRVGLRVLHSMVQESRSFNVRFNIYRGDPDIDEATFRDNTTSLFWLVLHVWSAHPVRPTNPIVSKTYVAIRNLLKSLFRGVGNLIAMHSIQMLAEFGLLPPWLQTYSSFDHTGRVFQWYADRFNMAPTIVQAKRLMASLPTGMERQLGLVINEAVVENLACKTYQRSGGTTETRRDVHHHQAPILTRTQDGSGLIVVFEDGEVQQLESDCIVPRWRFGSGDLLMGEIAALLELPAALPGLRSLGNSRLPVEARARPVTTDVPFAMPRWWR